MRNASVIVIAVGWRRSRGSSAGPRSTARRGWGWGRRGRAETHVGRGRQRDFFLQAEDGIRDYKVTGVQTCALPIFARSGRRERQRAAAAGLAFQLDRVRLRRRGAPLRPRQPDTRAGTGVSSGRRLYRDARLRLSAFARGPLGNANALRGRRREGARAGSVEFPRDGGLSLVRRPACLRRHQRGLELRVVHRPAVLYPGSRHAAVPLRRLPRRARSGVAARSALTYHRAPEADVCMNPSRLGLATISGASFASPLPGRSELEE